MIWRAGPLFKSSTDMHPGLQEFHLAKWRVGMMETGWREGRMHVLSGGLFEKGLSKVKTSGHCKEVSPVPRLLGESSEK